MTECERIIEQGILPESFFEEEVRCDFLVTKEKKRVWAVSIDLLLRFEQICKKHHLRWWLAFGTLLGAVRHRGFIPWDDDVDVCMPREDYEKLLSLGGEFDYPYFLQTPYTDKRYFYSYAKLRNSNTTSLSKNFCYNNNNNGIALDIFCVDDWEKDGEDEKIFSRIKNLIINNSTYMKIGHPNFEDDERVKNYDGANPFDTYEEIQRLAKTYHGRETEYVAMPVITIYGYERDVFRRDSFSETLLTDFEGLKFPVPYGYDKILSTIYMDYMSFPPIEKRGQWHSAIIDADKPYKYYYDALLRGEDLWKR